MLKVLSFHLGWDYLENTLLTQTRAVLFEGKTHTLEEIFSKAGINLEVKINDQILDLGDSIKRSELHSLMSRYSGRPQLTSPFSPMYAYLVIVNAWIRERNPNTGLFEIDKTVLGAMFDSATRKGTAVFYKHDTIQKESIAYLRTTAHEIGHQFNLHHRDGDMYTVDESNQRKYTIMNQTKVIRTYGGWPSGIALEFGGLELEHLAKHPKINVAPGNSPFDGKCQGSGHEEWHHDAANRLGVTDPTILTTFDSPEIGKTYFKLDLHIEMGKKEYLPGQPCIAYLKLTNKGSEPVSVIDDFDPERSIVKFYINKDNNEIRFLPFSYVDILPEEKQLNPGESIYRHAKIFYGANRYSFPDVGIYKLRATYQGISDGLGKIIDSNIIDVVIRAPKEGDEEEQVKLIKGDEQVSFVPF